MYEQIKLDYAFDALEPYIDTATMEVHYQKHHATYTKNFNDVTQKAKIADKPAEIIMAEWKAGYQGKDDAQAIRNNGGGFYNHNLYFGQFSPAGGIPPAGILAEKIATAFGSFDSFKDQISKLAMGQFGSGWAWLSTDVNGNLSISASPNQDNPIIETEGKIYPIMAIDVWEHAYYLKYKNVRADYVAAVFAVIDWNRVAANYEQALAMLNGSK